MTDDMFPGQGRDSFSASDGAFAGSFADEPPLTDMVPRALAVYERGRRRRQVAGVGGGVAAVAATVLVATQALGGAERGADGGVHGCTGADVVGASVGA